MILTVSNLHINSYEMLLRTFAIVVDLERAGSAPCIKGNYYILLWLSNNYGK